MVALPNGSYLGVPPPILMAGKLLTSPLHATFDGASTFTTTAARYYVAPFFVARTTTFAGVKFYNVGAGDNGKKVKIAFYNESSAGGPGTLAKDFSEVTLTGAAAVRTLASSWTAVGPAWYYGEFVCDGAANIASAAAGVGTVTAGLINAALLQAFAADRLAANSQQTYAGDYVAGTYANFPEATSLTPATSICVGAVGGGAGAFPVFGLYV